MMMTDNDFEWCFGWRITSATKIKTQQQIANRGTYLSVLELPLCSWPSYALHISVRLNSTFSMLPLEDSPQGLHKQT